MGKASRRRRERRLGLVPALFAPTTTTLVADFVPAQEGAGKISKALLDIVKPFLEGGFTLDQVRRVVYCAVVAWNLSLIDDGKRKAETDRLLHDMAIEDQAGFREWIDLLVECKVRLHPEDKRFIVSTEVLPNGDGYRILAVAAASAA